MAACAIILDAAPCCLLIDWSWPLARTAVAGLTYYYHFRVSVPRLVRAEDLTLQEDGLRQIELWMRYRPATDSYDLAFVRRDLLSSGGAWIKL